MVTFLPPDHGHFALVLIKRAHRQMLCKIAAMGAPFSVRDYFNRGRISSQAPRSTILPAMKPFHVEAQAASGILPISRRSSLFRSVPKAAGTQILPSYDGGACIFFYYTAVW